MAITLSSAPIIKDRLDLSNNEYLQLSETARSDRIMQLNKRWMSAGSASDSFIVQHLVNPVASFLEQQQTLFPGTYGEIFVTNRFGVMIASTGKLTTLAHAHKYWWKAAYNSGAGRVFIDDRGYDTSVDGYVIGVVVPIERDGVSIGFLKANINVLGPIASLIDDIKSKHALTAKLVRSNGKVVYESGITPLSTEVGASLKDCVSSLATLSMLDESSQSLVACTAVAVTIESEVYGFGGKGQSLDQLKGNVDETWSILLAEEKVAALAAVHETAKALIVIGLLIVIFATLLAWLLGRIAAKPIVALSDIAKAIGEGSLDARALEGAMDEIGTLAGSINSMALNLQNTMASRDELAKEVELRKEAEQRLRFLSSSVEQAQEAISITDNRGVIEYVNPAFTTVTGYEAAEAIGQNQSMLSSGTHSDAFFSSMWQSINSGKPWRGRIVDKSKDGTLYPAMMTISPIFSETREITHYVGIQQSLKEHEELETQLRQSQKMEALGILIGGIAHDFNNKLAGMTGNLYLAKLKSQASPDVVKNLETVESLSFQAADMIKRLLTFAHKDIGVEMRPFDLVSYIREVITLNKKVMPANIHFIQDICKQELVIRGDTNQMQQLLLNLLANARDAVSEAEKPVVILKVEPFVADEKFAENHPELESYALVHLMVKDNGCGMSDEVLNHVFEPFFTTKEAEGAGLGLAMAYGAIHQQGGIIELDNRGLGITVDIYLPLVDEKGSVIKEEDDNTGSEGRGETILVVDDNHEILTTMKDVLDTLGYRVLLASDGMDAVETYRTNRETVSLTIMDIIMPNLSGVKAAEKMKEIDPEVKVIFSSGYDREQLQQADMPPDQYDILVKPYQIGMVSRKIRALLDAS